MDKYEGLEEENLLLLEKNIQLELLNTGLKEIQLENNFLREQLNYLEEKNEKYYIAKVIGKSLSTYEHLIFVDKGSSDGIRVGDPVIVNEGILIGKIYKTYKTYSMVLLLVDNNSATAATIQNKAKTLGVVNGEFGLSMKMDFVPQTEELNIGEKVISSGLERFVPRGLLLGTIDSINYEQGELFKSAVVKPLINYDKIILVTILHVEEE
jgi:rod shape-determining protein MreC